MTQVAKSSAGFEYFRSSLSAALLSQNSTQSTSLISQKTKNSIMALLLPLELWIVIFDMVIEEGIIRLNQCDYNTFPYDHVFLSPGQDRYRFYGSYCRLRLVCRNFNALLGVRPECDLDASSFPFPTGIRALRMEGRERIFEELLVDTLRCGRLVFLNISCDLTADSTQLNLSDLLRAGEGGAFSNVQRLSLRLFSADHIYTSQESTFWSRLYRGFAQLVTLSIEVCSMCLGLGGEDYEVPTFERLEILFLGSGITWLGCRFPHLRLASVNMFWTPFTLETFGCQSHLECLLIRSHHARFSVDVRSFLRLRVLSLHEGRLQELVPLGCDHPVEHLWIYLADIPKNTTLIDEIVKRIPRIIRITMDLSSVTEDRRMQRIQEFKRMRLDWFGLALKPIKCDDNLLVIE